MNSCKLCGHVFQPETIPIIGETAQDRGKKLVTRFGKHIAKKHGETAPAFQQLMQAAFLSAQNLAFLNQFVIDDADMQSDLQQSRDVLRGLIDGMLLSPPSS